VSDDRGGGMGLPGPLLVVVLLAASLGGGFLIQRLVRPPAPGITALPTQAPAPVADADEAVPPAARVVPERLPEVTLPGLDGRERHLSQWHGKPLVVNFWATWCEPCRREMPLLRGLQHEHAADGLQVVGIAIDSAADVRKYAAAQGIDYPLLVGEDGGLAAAKAFGMDTVLPFSVFADRAGDIVALKVGELRAAEAHLILDRMMQVDDGKLTLAAARQEIAAAQQHEAAPPVASGS
jgi:thiol-disulfide isomerase/thioredoxin